MLPEHGQNTWSEQHAHVTRTPPDAIGQNIARTQVFTPLVVHWCYPENQIPHFKCYTCATLFRTHISILTSGDFYSCPFAQDRHDGGNRTTKLCLGTYLIPLYMTA